MVVISTAVCTKNRPLLARQFVQVPKQKVDSLLNSFCKLVENAGADHTYIETDSVRYVYQPLDGVYLLLITTKQSNIFEDFTTLRLFSSVVQSLCVDRNSSVPLETSILEKSFDLVFRIDEMITQGTREAVSLQSINTYAVMDSHEENIQNMITQNKEKEQNQKRREIAQRLDKERLQGKREPPTANTINIGLEYENYPPQRAEPIAPISHENEGPNIFANNAAQYQVQQGMQLGAKRPVPPSMPYQPQQHQSYEEEQKPMAIEKPREPIASAQSQELAIFQGHPEPVVVLIQEKIKADLLSEGGVRSVDLNGTFFVFVNDETSAAFLAFKLTPENQRFKLKAHPIVDRNALPKECILRSKDIERPFPFRQPTPVLKWRAQEQAEDLVPVSFSCWPSATSTGCSYTVEVEATEMDKTVEDMQVIFNFPPGAQPHVTRVDGGEVELEHGNTLKWVIENLNDPCGLEFEAQMDPQALFPFYANFNANHCNSDINVLKCFSAKDENTEIEYKLIRSTEYSLVIS